MRNPRVELIYFDAGGGHRNAMKALVEVLALHKPNWTVVTTDFQEVLLPVDPVFLATRVKSQDVYNSAISHGWTRGSRPYLRAMQAAIRLHSPLLERQLIKHWRASRPDLVVSLIPNFNGVMYRALQSAHPDVPFVTIMTDIADTPPHFWQEPQDQYMICGSAKAYMQARLTGWYRPERVFKTSGMMLSPSFYAPPGNQRLTREAIGLDESKITLLISFGGNGSAVACEILKHIAAACHSVQTIVLCGRNEKLRSQLETWPSCRPIGFTDRVADYMRLANVFVGKPGPGSISEALHMGLPVIVENTARTLIQERYNATWIEEQGAGIVLGSFAEIGNALNFLLSGDTLAEFVDRAKAHHNTAVFEIPELLSHILDEVKGSGRSGNYTRDAWPARPSRPKWPIGRIPN